MIQTSREKGGTWEVAGVLASPCPSSPRITCPALNGLYGEHTLTAAELEGRRGTPGKGGSWEVAGDDEQGIYIYIYMYICICLYTHICIYIDIQFRGHLGSGGGLGLALPLLPRIPRLLRLLLRLRESLEFFVFLGV